MTDFRLFTHCETCRKWRFYIAKREVKIPQINRTATSKKLMCSPCHKAINNALKPKP